MVILRTCLWILMTILHKIVSNVSIVRILFISLVAKQKKTKQMTTCVKSHKFVGSFTHQFCFVDSFIKFYTSETLFFFILCFLKKEEDSKPNRNLQEFYDSFGIRRNPDPGLVVYASMRLTLFHPFDLFTLLTCNTLQMICTHQKPKLNFYLFSLSFLY